MNLNEFARIYNDQQQQVNQQLIWFRLDKDESAKIVIIEPNDGKSSLAIAEVVYVQGLNGSRNIRVNTESYALLEKHNMVPMGKSLDGETYPRKPSTRMYFNVLDLRDNKIKVWETSKSIARKIAQLNSDEDIPPVHESIIKITKRSTGSARIDVEYDIQLIGKAELTQEQREACEVIYDLDKITEPHSLSYIRSFVGVEDDNFEMPTEIPPEIIDSPINESPF